MKQSIIFRCLLIALFLINFEAYSQAQKIEISGVVVDENNLPILGAQVIKAGTTTGTITDTNGMFNISAESGEQIIVSFMGYDNYTFSASQENVKIALTTTASEIEEVVVIAYGTQKKRDVIGSVSTVKADDLVAASGGNFISALQGSAAGLQVVSSGIDGSVPQIKIRGVSSISSDTDPLWVIDGVVGGQDDVNMNDIESINVLKDASATAIYGSRGSNGVIVVTTKRGKAGAAPKVSVSLKYGLTPIINEDIGYASASESLEIINTSHQNTYGTDYNPADYFTYANSEGVIPLSRDLAYATSSDSFDAVTRLGNFYDMNVSITSGGEYTSNYASINYRNDEFSLEGAEKQRILARYNTQYTKNNVNLGISLSGKYTKDSDISDWDAVSRVMPFMPIYDSSSPLGLWGTDLVRTTNLNNYQYNPLINLDPELRDNVSEQLSLRASLYMDYDFKHIDGLSLRLDANYNFGFTQNNVWRSMLYSPQPDKGIYGSRAKNNSWGQQYHAYFTYNKTFDKHSLTAVGGTEINISESDNLLLEGEDVMGYYQELYSIGDISTNSRGYLAGENRTMGFFARLDYKFMDRYLLGASFMREGTARFIEENRWGNFFSLSAGWIISDEDFLKDVDWISQLKLRGSIGETGNQNIPSVATQTVISNNSTNGYLYNSSSFYQSVGNKATKWEKTQSIDLGLDFAFLNNRVNGSIAYYRQNVSDMLMSLSLPASAGLGKGTANINDNNMIWTNVGDMYNQGIELSVFYDAVRTKDFNWNTSFTFTTNKNEVTALNPTLDSSGNGVLVGETLLKTGQSLGTYYMATAAGVDPQTGVPLIYKVITDPVTGNTTVTDEKITAEKSNLMSNKHIHEGKTGLPTWFGSWRNSFKYKQFDMSVSLYFSGGNYIYNETNLMIINDGTSRLKSEWLTDSWKQAGDVAKFPQLQFKDGYKYDADFEPVAGRSEYNPLNNGGVDYALEKADFLRLQDVTVGYTLSDRLCEKLRFSRARVYLSMSNIFTITGFEGYNPDMAVNSSNAANKAAGITFDKTSLPMTAIYTFGLDFSF